MVLRASILLFLTTLAANASAQSIEWHGYLDMRVVAPSDARAWDEGGLGKARFGDDDNRVGFGTALLAGTWHVTPALVAFADVQFLPEQRHSLDVLDAYVRYRPVSTTPWRWSLKAGAFFAPISLENDSIGWTSHWTLTPSAINSWVGEELRTVGTELQVEHRGATRTFKAVAAVFGWNDPAGELLAARGWALGDLTSGFGAVLREPDVYASRARAPVPMLYRPFREIDHRVGWYAGVGVEAPGRGELALLHYDNRADPTAWENYVGHRTFAWHTRFWSLGAKKRLGDTVLIAQTMIGNTAFEPQPGLYLDTEMRAGYLLAGWGRGDWRPALRVDFFDLRQTSMSPLSDPLSEHGSAVTLALNWRPNERMRLTGEVLRIDSTRQQRKLAGLAPRQIELQLQLGIRLFF